MANYMGGSDPAMASQIGDGYILLSANHLKGFLPGELSLLRQEIDKLLREVRALVPPQDDAQALQAESRSVVWLGHADRPGQMTRNGRAFNKQEGPAFVPDLESGGRATIGPALAALEPLASAGAEEVSRAACRRSGTRDGVQAPPLRPNR
jgi:hypothetical protein